LYDYTCENGHDFEHASAIADYRDEMPCTVKDCSATARRQYRPSGYRAQNFDPIIVHRDASGHYRVPGSPSDPVAPGYERVELRTMSDIRRVQSEIGRENYEKFERRKAREEQHFSEQRKEARSELMARLRTAFGRDLARVAMAENDNRARERYDPHGSYFDVMENDRSNRVPHNDRETGWKDIRR
jgi:hypothetical protein